MRRLWLILFVAMLPLQWSSAAVAALCLTDAGHGAPRVAAHRHAMAHDAAGRAGQAMAHAHGAAAHPVKLGANDAAAHAHDVPSAAHDAALPAHDAALPAHDVPAQASGAAGHAPGPTAAQAPDGGLPGDCGGCCQAACQALPARAARTQALAAPQALPEQADRPIAPPALEGPFRPPRSVLA